MSATILARARDQQQELEAEEKGISVDEAIMAAAHG
jgi:hypothetical protein